MKQVVLTIPEINQPITVDNCSDDSEYGILTNGRVGILSAARNKVGAIDGYRIISLGTIDSSSNFIQNNYCGERSYRTIEEAITYCLNRGMRVYTFDSTLKLLKWAATEQEKLSPKS